MKVFGFAGWSVFNSTEHADDAWNLVAYLSSPESNSTWAKRVGVIPIHQGADQDPFFKTEQFKGWFEELNGDAWVPTVMPTYLEQWGYFGSTVGFGFGLFDFIRIHLDVGRRRFDQIYRNGDSKCQLY